jgi:predicted TIM-barrel fold metal-dependent hydrolase
MSQRHNMLVADAQVHIWAANTPERPWPVKSITPHRPEPFSKDDLLREMDAAGVDRVVIVPPTWEGGRNDVGLQAAQAHPQRLAVMGRIDVGAPDAKSRIAHWLEPGMLGMRLTIKLTEDDTQNWIWQQAEAAGVPIMMVVHRGQQPLIDRIAERHPDLRITLDHLGIPQGGFRIGLRDEAAFADLDHVLALAQRPNIAVKASALPGYTTDSYPYRRLHPILRRVYDAFGPRRIFWGTDLTKLPCTYLQSVTMITEEIPWLTTEDKQWIMGRGLCEWLGWKLP